MNEAIKESFEEDFYKWFRIFLKDKGLQFSQCGFKLGDALGSDISEKDQLHYAEGLAGRLEREESVMNQVLNNDPNQIMHGSFPQKLQDLVLDDMNEHQSMVEWAMETPENEVKLAHLVLRLLLDKHQRPGAVEGQSR